jgi:hypothetical protein
MKTTRAAIVILAVTAILVLASTAAAATTADKVCPTLTGHACYQGTVAFPKNGFSWFPA